MTVVQKNMMTLFATIAMLLPSLGNAKTVNLLTIDFTTFSFFDGGGGESCHDICIEEPEVYQLCMFACMKQRGEL